MKRYAFDRGSSKAEFRRNSGVHPKNYSSLVPMRGGYRL